MIFTCIILAMAAMQKLHDWRHGIGENSSQTIQETAHVGIDDWELAVATLQESDPDFDPAAFENRFAGAFHQIQDAWAAQDMERVRAFVSDGVFERFTLQILEQRDLGYRDHMEDIRIERATIAEAASGGIFDVVTIMVAATLVDYRVSLETGTYLSGEKKRHGFTEFWSFVRRTGARTVAGKPGLIEGSCPNCGAAIQMNQTGKCESCEALLRSGEFDWILSEITQACEWKPHAHEGNRSARLYRDRHDPAFNVQHIEDRASVIFWRKAMADRLADTQPILKMATAEFCAELAKEWRQRSVDDHRDFAGGCSVGCVDLLGMLDDGKHDLAMVEIRWSATTHRVEMNGTVKDRGDWSRFRTLHVLGRKSGVVTDVNRGIDSAHCPACGAPESALVSHACEYCGAVLNTGDHDWVLFQADDMGSSEAQAWLARLKRKDRPPAAIVQRVSPTSFHSPLVRSATEASHDAPLASPSDALAWMIVTLAADGEIHANEHEAVLRIARNAGISEPMVDGLIETALRGELDAPAPPDQNATREWMALMADVALADGVVQTGELNVLAQLGAHFDYQRADIALLIAKRRTRLLRFGRA